MNYWKLMAGKGSQNLMDFLDGNYIAVGFAQTDIPSSANTADDFRQLTRETMEGWTEGEVRSGGAQLCRFYREMNVGDRVLVYEPGTRLYHIADVKSEPRYDATKPLWHVRDVEWIDTVPRDDLSVTAKNSLGAILALFSVNEEVQQEIEQAMQGQPSAGPPDEEEQEVEEYGAEVVNQASEFLKDQILKLSWDEMQELVAGLIRALGFRTTVSPPGPDRGKDIVASPDGLGLHEPRIFVEVKHRKGQIGAPDVRSFITTLRGAKGIYVSTGGFSKDAHLEAERSDSPVTLMDIDELARNIVHYYDNFDIEARTLLPLRKIYWPIT